MKILEQGDVLLFAENIPNSAKERLATNVLMHGEHTGHAHRLDRDNHLLSDDAELPQMIDRKFEVLRDPKSNVVYLRMYVATPLRHEEHAPITIPPGDYRVGQVREKGMFDDLIAPVVD